MRCAIVIPALAASALIAGCGGGGDGAAAAPVACLSGSGAYLDALADAPGDVLLGGESPIGDCLTRGQPGGELASVGEAVIAAATKLNAGARRKPGGPENVSLGYLVGALQRSAASTGGIHSDLIRRLDGAARFNPGGGSPGAEFERAFGKGYAAGQAAG